MRAGSWPTAATTVVGVIGNPVAHSLSPLLHNSAFAALDLDWISVGFPLAEGATAAAVMSMRDLGIAGLSVTMPHKSAMARLVDQLDPVARRLGAVNCCVRRDSSVIGSNTDGEGFLEALRRATGFTPQGRSCVVMGAGGAARAVILALAESGAAKVVVVARQPSRAQAAATLAGDAGEVVPAGSGSVAAHVEDAELCVNATPVGMAGSPAQRDKPLISPEILKPGQVAVDLVYHPRLTPWLAAAKERGARTVNGLGMLVHQAAAQLQLWTGQEIPVQAMWRAAERHA